MADNKKSSAKGRGPANKKVSVSRKSTAHSARKTRVVHKKVWNFPFGMANLKFILLGVAVIIIGYLLMATGITEKPALPDSTWDNPMAVIIAPILLIIGYCIIIPYALMKMKPARVSENDGKE